MDKYYKYGIISGNNLILFNDSEHSASLLNSDFLEDVNIEIKENGVCELNAKRIEYDFYSYCESICGRVFEGNWNRTPHPKKIKEGKKYFWSRKKEKYVSVGWVRTTEITPVQYILNKYKIEIYD